AEAAGHYAGGRLDAAADRYRAALQIEPGHAGVLHNLGVVLAGQGDQPGAIACFDAALSIEPAYAAAHLNRALALVAAGSGRQAIDSFARALHYEPENYAAHREIAFCLLAEGHRGRALDHFARTYDLRRGDDRHDMAIESLARANQIKLQHDAQ